MRVDVYVTKTFGLWVTSTLHVVATRWLKDDLLEVGSHDGWIELSTLHVVQRKVMESWNGRGCVPSLGKTMKTNDYTSLHRSLDRVERVTCMIGKGECIRYVGVFFRLNCIFSNFYRIYLHNENLCCPSKSTSKQPWSDRMHGKDGGDKPPHKWVCDSLGRVVYHMQPLLKGIFWWPKLFNWTIQLPLIWFMMF